MSRNKQKRMQRVKAAAQAEAERQARRPDPLRGVNTNSPLSTRDYGPAPWEAGY